MIASLDASNNVRNLSSRSRSASSAWVLSMALAICPARPRSKTWSSSPSAPAVSLCTSNTPSTSSRSLMGTANSPWVAGKSRCGTQLGS